MAVEIDGAVELKAALQRFTPDLAYNMEKRIDKALVPVVKEARNLVPSSAPLSTWAKYSAFGGGRFPSFDPVKAKDGIKYTTEPTKPNRKGFSYAATVFNASAGGAIYETAGRRNPNGRKQAPMVKHYTDAGTPMARFEGRYIRSGTKNNSKSNNPNAGKQFIQAMPPLVDARDLKLRGRRGRNMKGRLIYKAWKDNQGHAYNEVNLAIQDAINQFYKRSASRGITTNKYTAPIKVK